MPGLLHPVPHRRLPLTQREQPLQQTRLLRHRHPYRRVCHTLDLLRILLSGNRGTLIEGEEGSVRLTSLR
jgi:hypothetical protein